MFSILFFKYERFISSQQRSLSVSICENEEEVNRNISLMELSYSIGLAIGPVMGTFLYESFGWEVPFFILAGLNLFSNLTV